MRIVFIGTVTFSRMMLEAIIEQKAEVVGVVTKKESPFHADFCDLSGLCRKKRIPFRYVGDINSMAVGVWVKKLKPDFIFCFGYSQIITKPLLDLATKGVMGFHPAMLPANRGRHPLVWALALGLKRTANTFFLMNEHADAGDIISQKTISIRYRDTATTLYAKMVKTARRQLKELLPLLKSGGFKKIPQNNLKANYWRLRQEKDGEIDFRMSSRAVYNLVRALSKPYVGAHIVYRNERIKVWKVMERRLNKHLQNIEPGKILKTQGTNILVKCYYNAVLITDHDFKRLPKEGEYL